METARRFPILFTGANRLMVAIGILPSRSYVEVGPEIVRVRLGWSFSADIPVGRITGVAEDRGRALGWGAHGWRGEWLVNGSSRNLVAIDVAPEVRARLVFVPVRLRRLRVSVVDPAGLVTALAASR